MKILLDAQGIYKHYANHTALDNVSIQVPKGTIFGLLGPNGAGKTSLIRIITQITAADQGQVFFDGEPLQPKHIERIGYLPEERGLYKKMQVLEQLMYLAQLKGMPAKEAKQRIKEWGERLEITSWWKKNIEDLSKGMQQKVQFVATVLHEPELIILDEPFTGFDPINANLLKDEILRLRDMGCTIIFSTHRMESVEELCDHIALISQSRKVLDGGKQQIKERYKANTYLIETDANLQLPREIFELQETKPLSETGRILSRVKILQGGPNELLSAAIHQAQVFALRENIPSMNEVFISIVGEAKAKTLLEG